MKLFFRAALGLIVFAGAALAQGIPSEIADGAF
jgi:hypothetical protein